MNNDENNEQNIDKQEEPKGSRFKNAASKLNNLRNDFHDVQNDIQDRGLIPGLAKAAFDNKKDQIKDNIKGKINDKSEQLKGKINNKIPASVQQKQQALKAKADNIKNKVNAPLNKVSDLKNKVNDAKARANEKAFKTGVKAAANAIAPGTGTAAEKILDTPVGKEAVNAARNASNPATAIKEGTKKLLEIVVKKEVVKKTAMILLPTFIVLFIVIVVVLSITSKHEDSQTYAHGAAQGEFEEEINTDYVAFYENIDKFANNKAMVIAVLTAAQDNEKYNDENNEDEECTDEEVQNGKCADETDESGITKYSKNKIKKYIKKVSKAIEDSDYDITEGDYLDRNTGSEFFWWLYDDFIEDYYSDYVEGATGAELAEKKRDIIEYIYLYYEDIKNDSNIIGVNYSAICPSGVTITSGSNAGTYDLEEYVAGVVKAEVGCYTSLPEVLKAFAVAARGFLAASNKCEIQSSSNFQNFKKIDPSDPNDQIYISAATETAGKVIMKANGKYLKTAYATVPADKYIDRNGDNLVYHMLHDPDDPKTAYDYKIKQSEIQAAACKCSCTIHGISKNSDHHWGMPEYAAVHEATVNNKTYEEILKIFYGENITLATTTLNVEGGIVLGNQGIYSASIFPINFDLNNLVLTQGYLYDSGSFHGAIDLFCNRSTATGDVRTFCTSIPIVASHSGKVVSVLRDQHCANPKNSNLDRTLPVSSSCQGNGVTVQVVDTSDPYYGYKFTYWHFDKVADEITNGTTVSTGQFLGYMGSTGNSTGWHLHFAITNAKGEKINQNSNILRFCQDHGLANDGIRSTGAGPSG